MILGLALVASALVVSRPLRELAAARTSLTVKGFAERQIDSDLAVVTVLLTARGKAARDAKSRLQDGEKRVCEVLSSVQSEIEESPAQLNPQFKLDARGNPTAEVDSYQANRFFKVHLREVAKADDLNRALENLLGEGWELNPGAIEYLCTNLAGLKADLLEDAMKDARLRADKMAGHGGRKLGRILSAQQGVFQLTDPYSTEVSTLGIVDTGSRKKSLKATVTVQYQLQ